MNQKLKFVINANGEYWAFTKKPKLSFAGGKDSTASIIVCYECGISVDGVVISEVMFDNARNISGENPEHIAWVYNVAIPIIEKQFGFRVYVLRDKSDYVQEFHHVIKTSHHAERIGKMRGWFIGGMCIGNDRLKMQPIKDYKKQFQEPITIYTGIAYDEPERYKRLFAKNTDKEINVCPLVDLGITEKQAMEICRQYDLVSPIYNDSFRGGCWFCPKQSNSQLFYIYKNYPELWAELKRLEPDSHNTFKPGTTLADLEKKFEIKKKQINFWEAV